MKKCVKCKQTKDIGLFSNCAKSKDKKQSYCKECIRNNQREDRIKNPLKIKASQYASFRKVKFTEDNLRMLILTQNGKCVLCGDSLINWEIDHIVPVSLGGSSQLHNLQILCVVCNQAKQNLPQSDFVAHCKKIAYFAREGVNSLSKGNKCLTKR